MFEIGKNIFLNEQSFLFFIANIKKRLMLINSSMTSKIKSYNYTYNWGISLKLLPSLIPRVRDNIVFKEFRPYALCI